MIRKMLIVAAAVAMPVSVVAASAGTATASTPKVDATTATVTCTGITAAAKFNPALTTAGSAASNEVTSIKGSASGCTTNDGVTVTGVKVSGVITSAGSTHTCGALASPTTETGNLTATWKTSPKLTAKSSVLPVNTVTGGVGGNGNATFKISFGTPSGDFQGTDAGALDATDAMTTTSIASILGSCGGKGLKSIGVTTDTNAGAAPAIVLG